MTFIAEYEKYLYALSVKIYNEEDDKDEDNDEVDDEEEEEDDEVLIVQRTGKTKN